jgi:arylsulfatase A
MISLLASAVALPRAPLEKPNIVMFFVDDLGYGDLGYTGNTMTHTPNIDKLAHSGKILSSWYSGCPVCSGSRAALLTGRQYTRVGVPGVFGDSSKTGLPLNETTVADQLKKVGYKTGIMGKVRASRQHSRRTY